MRNLVILFVHVIATLARLWGPGGIRSVLAESVLVKQQLLILNRSRQRSPNLRTSDRLVAGLCAFLVRTPRLIRSAIVLKPSTLLSLHQALRNRKYRLVFSSKRKGRPGPKGPHREPLSVWSVASQSADIGGDRDQNCPLCSPVPSLLCSGSSARFDVS